MSKKSARIKAAKYLNRAKDKFDMSSKQVRSLMSKAGVRTLDSQNDLRKMDQYLKEQNKPSPSPQPSAVNRAVEQTGLSAANVQGIASDIGIRTFDSDNDIRKVQEEIDKREEDRITSSTTYTTQVDNYNTLKDDYDKTNEELTTANEELTTANTAVGTLTTNYGQLEKDYKTAQTERDSYKEFADEYKGEIDTYKSQIEGYQGDINRYKTDFSNLTSQYQEALRGNQDLVTARNEAEAKFRDQTAAYEAAKGERDRYREAQVGAQLSGLRGGATAGGGNQTSYGGGSLASGRTGYTPSSQDSDRGLADYIREQGGATDSVLNREGPVVQLIGRSQQGSGAASGQPKRMTSGAGTGSYYASRFG